MTPDLLHALADVLNSLGGLKVAGLFDGVTDDDVDAALDDLADTGDAVSAALGLDPDATWEETAAALRARADAIARTAEHADKIDTATNAALLATITAAHAGDLAAASEAASLAFGLLGLDGVFRVRVETATTLTPGLPEGWEWCDVPLFLAYAANREAGVWVAVGSDGNLYINGGFGRTINHADAAAVRAVLARAGVTS